MTKVYIGINGVEENYFLFFYRAGSSIFEEAESCFEFSNLEDAQWACDVWRDFLEGKV